MFLAVDIGNSSIKFGVFDGETLASGFSVPTHKSFDRDSFGVAVGNSIDLPIDQVIACSVVPDVEPVLTAFIHAKFSIDPVFVSYDFPFGLTIKYDPPEATGTDRLVNSFAAIEKYGTPCVVCSFGTATTIDVVNAKRELVGGLIAPGPETMAKALHLNTAKLPEVVIAARDSPINQINQTTETSIQAGIFFSQIGLVESVVARIEDEIGVSLKVVATGGFADLIGKFCRRIDVVDKNLTLDGLRMVYSRLGDNLRQPHVKTIDS